MSYELIVDWIRRLTRTSSLFARSPLTRGSLRFPRSRAPRTKI